MQEKLILKSKYSFPKNNWLIRNDYFDWPQNADGRRVSTKEGKRDIERKIPSLTL